MADRYCYRKPAATTSLTLLYFYHSPAAHVETYVSSNLPAANATSTHYCTHRSLRSLPISLSLWGAKWGSGGRLACQPAPPEATQRKRE